MVNDSTREYSVYVSDVNNTVSGSGVLFYAGGDTMFVFTCAHVVDKLDAIRLFFLKEIDASRDLYEVFYTDVPAAQIFFPREGNSSAGTISENASEDNQYTEDLAIIQVSKPTDMELHETDFLVTETRRSRPVYVQGYPNGVPEGRHPIEYLDCLHGNVVLNQADSHMFTIRLDENFIDSGNRVCELQGLSGAPVWDDNDEVNGLLGLLTNAYDSNALLSKVRATKAQRIRSVLKERFGVVLKRKLEGIPEEDVAGNEFRPTVFNGTIKQQARSENEKWIEDELISFRAIIEDLKLQKAIDKGRELLADPRFEHLTKDQKARTTKHLLYCYEIVDMDDEFEALEAYMREAELIKEHDTLRQFTRTFMRQQFQDTVNAAQQCIDTWDGSERTSLLSFAQAFLHLAKAYTEDLPVQETIGKLIDSHENFIYPTDEIEDEALAYQLIGYVYGQKYHDYVNAVRFLNRSYRVGYDSMVMESLAAAYYFLGIQAATDENGRIPDMRKIDRKALYKARECYLIIRDKADELYWSGTMRRMGLCVYNTFFFLQDNYRVLTIYQDIKKYLPALKDDEWRDVEMKYARISAQKGEIDTSELVHITTKDRVLLDAQAKASRCVNLIEDATANVPRDQLKNLQGLAKEMRDTARYLESAVRRIDRCERVPLYVQLINLYGRGMLIFGWDKKEKLNDLYQRLSEYADDDLLEDMSNFIFEMDAPIEETIERYKATFEKKKDIVSWQELNHLYIRHGMMDQADAMYRELLSERKELIEDGPEYAYRAFIDYVTLYKRDLKYAIQCYVDAKESFHDTDIERFWELELMLYSNSLNDPERFEVERRHFVEKGLVTEEQYQRAAFFAHLANLNDEKAAEHNRHIRTYPHHVHPKTGHILVNPADIQFLCWIGEIAPSFLPPADSMLKKAADVRNGYALETWHRVIDTHLLNQFRVNKTIAIDAWGLYQLLDTDNLDLITQFEHVYISHSSILRLLDELSKTNNHRIRILTMYLKDCPNVHIRSAAFKPQLEVRNVTDYTEPAAAVALGVEQDCLVIIGDPVVDGGLIDHVGNKIIRSSQIQELLS